MAKAAMRAGGVLVLLVLVAGSSADSPSDAIVKVKHEELGADRGRAWQRCRQNSGCPSRRCIHGRCAAPKGTLQLGQACFKDFECASKHCTGDTFLLTKYLRKTSIHGHCSEKSTVGSSVRKLLAQLIAPLFTKDFLYAQRRNQVSYLDGLKYGMKIVGYYDMMADHHRMRPVESRFWGRVKCVRLRLPREDITLMNVKGNDSLADMMENRVLRVKTKIGTVWSYDHELFSVKEVRHYLYKGTHFEYINGTLVDVKPKPKRCDLFATARVDTVLFSAVNVIVCFKDEEATQPMSYVFAAGMAAGKFYSYYAGHKPDFVGTSPHGYSPTPFSDHKGTYKYSVDWNLDLKKGSSPIKLNIASIHEGETEPYMTVTATYSPITDVDKMVVRSTLSKVITAVARVGAIGKALGQSLPPFSSRPITSYAKSLPWVVNPLRDGAPRPSKQEVAATKALMKKIAAQNKAVGHQPLQIFSKGRSKVMPEFYGIRRDADEMKPAPSKTTKKKGKEGNKKNKKEADDVGFFTKIKSLFGSSKSQQLKDKSNRKSKRLGGAAGLRQQQ